MTINAVDHTMQTTLDGSLENLDLVPDQFIFTDQTDVPLSSETQSDWVTITGINAETPVTVTDGEWRINGAAQGWSSSPGVITVGQQIKVKHTSSATNNTSTSTTLTIGGVSDVFTSTTLLATGDGISSIAGLFSHNSTVVINGSSFGIKSPVEPWLWDDFEGGTIDTELKGNTPTIGTAVYEQYGDGYASQYKNDRAWSGTQSAYTFNPVNSGTSSDNFAFRGQATQTRYMSYMRYRGGSYSGNHKGDRHTANLGNPGNNNPPYDAPPNVGRDYYLWRNNCAGFINLGENVSTPSGWSRVEQWIDVGDVDVANGVYQYWTDLALDGDAQNILICTSGCTNGCQIDTWLSPNNVNQTSGDMEWWVDNLYVDNTRKRVELGDNADYNSCTERVIQVPNTTWNDNQIQITVNTGQFSVGSTKYLFVVDENGVASDSYPVVISEYTHGETVRLAGTGFGTNELFLWDTIDNQVSYSGYTDGQQIPETVWDHGAFGNVMEFESSGGRHQYSSMHYKGTGKSYLEDPPLPSDPARESIYIQWRHKYNLDTYGDGGSNKVLRVWDDTGGTNTRISWTSQHMTYSNSNTSWSQTRPSTGSWHLHECWVDQSTGTIKAYLDGTIKHDVSDLDDNAGPLGTSIKLLGFDPSSTTTYYQGMINEFDEVYISETRKRVEITDSQIYSKTGNREIQSFTAWTDTYIDITVNQGEFSDLSGKWVHVLDENENEMVGYPIQIDPPVTGTFADGNSITITDTGLGNYTNSYEYLGGADGYIETTADGPVSNFGGWDFDDGGEPISIVSDSNPRSGNKCIFVDCDRGGSTANGAIIYDYGQSIPAGEKVYISWWVKYNGETDGQWKMFRLNWEKGWVDTSPEIVMFNWLDGTGKQLITRSPGDGMTYYGAEFPSPNNGKWYRMEWLITESTQGVKDGRIDGFRHTDGEVIVENTASNSGDTAPLFPVVKTYNDSVRHRYFVWQNYIGNGIETADIHMDDFYIQVGGHHRLEIGNNATYANCTLREIQPWTSWADNQIQFKFNKGGLSSGTNYLFVIDENNNVTNQYTVDIT